MKVSLRFSNPRSTWTYSVIRLCKAMCSNTKGSPSILQPANTFQHTRPPIRLLILLTLGLRAPYSTLKSSKRRKPCSLKSYAPSSSLRHSLRRQNVAPIAGYITVVSNNEHLLWRLTLRLRFLQSRPSLHGSIILLDFKIRSGGTLIQRLLSHCALASFL